MYLTTSRRLVEAESVRSGRSETDLILDEWGTWGSREQRPTVDDLVTLLTELSLYRAADYININVLDGEGLRDGFVTPTSHGHG